MLYDPSKVSISRFSGNAVCKGGVFYTIKTAKVYFNPVLLYLGEVSLSNSGNPFHAQPIARIGVLISEVLTSACEAQVCPAIIRRIHIPMVNLVRWPSPLHPQKRQPRCQMSNAIYRDLAIAVAIDRARDAPGQAPVVPIHLPSPNPRLRVVVEKFANTFGSRMHVAMLLPNKGGGSPTPASRLLQLRSTELKSERSAKCRCCRPWLA